MPINDEKNRPPSWRRAIVSTVLSILTLAMFQAHGYVHWNVLFKNGMNLSDEERASWQSVLGWLEFYRIFGIAAVISAVLALRSSPKWSVLLYGILAVLAGLVSVIVM